MCLESLGLLLGSHMDHKEVAGLEFDPDTGPRAHSVKVEAVWGNG